MSYPLYRVASLGAPRNHHAIFVQTEDDDTGAGAGIKFHVTGNIQNGMTFEKEKTAQRPESRAGYVGKILLGRVAAGDLARVEDICRGVPPPKKQFQGGRRLFPKEPLRRCQEWTRETIEALRAEGVLRGVEGEEEEEEEEEQEEKEEEGDCCCQERGGKVRS
ncbi:hypothetical protein E4U41_003125 [Claviceps citrina]|nr:hypothetical protein E4U41_003125 [Claviceps citrina]